VVSVVPAIKIIIAAETLQGVSLSEAVDLVIRKIGSNQGVSQFRAGDDSHCPISFEWPASYAAEGPIRSGTSPPAGQEAFAVRASDVGRVGPAAAAAE
jgi:hypothetical protein